MQRGGIFVRHCANLVWSDLEERLQEDDSFDAESFHALETVGYLLIGQAGPPGVGRDANFVAMGDSITFSIGDNIPDDNFLGEIRPAGGYPPILTDLYASQLGANVLIANEGIPGDRSVDGLGDVTHILNAYPLADYFLLLYGANDAGFTVRSGVGLSPGQPGYVGSFKGNMQQIITLID